MDLDIKFILISENKLIYIIYLSIKYLKRKINKTQCKKILYMRKTTERNML